MVKFWDDQAVKALEPFNTFEHLRSLLSLLCGEQIDDKGLSEEAKDGIEKILKRAKENLAISYEEFNELLLIFNQYRVERPFFDFFFLHSDQDKTSVKTSISFSDLQSGVSQFRGFALLCYGNFRFAYRELSKIKVLEEFKRSLEPWIFDSTKERKKYEDRKEPLLKLTSTEDQIPKDKTQWLGYLTGDRLVNDLALLRAIAGKAFGKTLKEVLEGTSKESLLSSRIKNVWKAIKKTDTDHFRNKIDQLESKCTEMRKHADMARQLGIKNTLKYLTWDYLDVYVATSMRQEWEFEETFTFIKEVFEERLCKKGKLPLRWFDPTQSYDSNLIDKGLLEGLMLRRAKLSIYMAQENDTLGKDSELAATLAQGKPVIAYVREIKNNDLPNEADQMKRRPCRYFKQRLTYLLSDAFFEKPDNRQNVLKSLSLIGISFSEEKFKPTIEKYLKLLYDFESNRRFELISDEEEQFRKLHRADFESLAKFMAAVEHVTANNRAKTIQSRHPLSMQVNLQTGVANGVLVVRNYDDCAQVIEQVLTRSLEFDISTEKSDDPKNPQVLGTALREKITKSKFRIVTENECLTNSFWNFYLEA